ncbi:hypothetical protein V6N12_031261 [Hibiscus sabdariffa]|uniref:Uncharacterized protein n=1 Tax=Hibiscus sabdariffa TaxID=183260 RepID=A0ABR2EAJ7_9ROSI
MVLGIHHMENILHYEERMIQGFCETMLPATGSRRILLHTRGAWISARNDHPRQIDETADRSCTEATLKKKTQNSSRQKMNTCRDSRPRQRRQKYKRDCDLIRIFS